MNKEIIIRYTDVAEIDGYTLEYRWNESRTINVFEGNVNEDDPHAHNVTVREVDIIMFSEQPSFDEVLETITESWSAWRDQIEAVRLEWDDQDND